MFDPSARYADGHVIAGHIMKLIDEKRYVGRISDPTSSARIAGICGDTMECYLVIAEDRIINIRFDTNGCMYTVACATATAHRAQGKTIHEALAISAQHIIEELRSLPHNHRHCAILAVSTLYRAIADYWLKA